MVGEILDEVEGVEFVRFGGDDVVRHRLVQRIVEAYDEHARAGAGAAPANRRRALEPARGRGHRDAAAAGRAAESSARRWHRRSASAGVDDGHVAVEFVDAERIAQLNREYRGQGRADRRALVPGRRDRWPVAGPRELGDVVICPAHTEDLREAVVHGALHLTGMDHETDDGEMLALPGRDPAWCE